MCITDVNFAITIMSKPLRMVREIS